MIASVVAFEVLRFEAVPAAAGVALLELEGRFASGAVPARPRLLVEWGGRSQELPAVVHSGGVGGTPWSATFAVPLEAVDADGSGFAIVPGRGPVIGLPSPDLAPGEDDRFVRLARGANDLRHRLAEASASAATSNTRYAEVAEERDRLAAELAAARERAGTAERDLAAATTAVKEVRAAAEVADREAAEARAGADGLRERLDAETTRAEAAEAATTHERALREEQRAELERLHEEMATAAEEAEELQARLAAAEDEAEAAQRELRDVRSRLTALQRERSLERPATPHGAVSVESAPLEWDDDGDEDDVDEPEPTVAIAVDPEPTETMEVDPPTRRTIRLEPHDDDEILPPAAVGARLIEPSSTKPPMLTPARIAVGVAVLLLFIALVIIFAGGGLVG